ncbi:MAG: mannosyl-3-phosphoglycerate phosphatase [Candidatus Woesearchaeota archaeon]|jgi:mannosyl-3-phosphoglycerate phosphatase|nr:mannosyl-3-phosphoglycerate phosphatase [Candidatus Woesearchaeota archaeon]
MKKIIFTDLDGTLLDYKDYSYDEAEEGLELIKRESIPLIICSGKTRLEIELYRKKLGNKHPFISENGGGVFIPKGYFEFEFDFDSSDEDYFIIKLGLSHDELISKIKGLKEKVSFEGFSDMSVEEISNSTGLPLNQAELAKKREFSEPIKINSDEVEMFKEEVEKLGLKQTHGGRFYHIMGGSDKGKAVKILIELFRKKFGEMESVGIGDSRNDFRMLDNVDKAYMVKKEDGSFSSKDYIMVDGVSSVGWNKVVIEELQ